MAAASFDTHSGAAPISIASASAAIEDGGGTGVLADAICVVLDAVTVAGGGLPAAVCAATGGAVATGCAAGANNSGRNVVAYAR